MLFFFPFIYENLALWTILANFHGKKPCMLYSKYYMIPHGRGVGTIWSLRSLPTEPFYDLVIPYVYVSYYAEVAFSPKTTHNNSIISLRDTVKWNSVLVVMWSINLARGLQWLLCVHTVNWRDRGSFGSYCWPCSTSIKDNQIQVAGVDVQMRSRMKQQMSERPDSFER